MTDIKRTRPRVTGMTAPLGMADPLAGRLIAELQERVRGLSARPAVVASAGEDTSSALVRLEMDRTARTLRTLAGAQGDAARMIEAVRRALASLHAVAIRNDLGEEIPAYSVVRGSDYSPDTQIYTAAKPLGPEGDAASLLFFTGPMPIPDKAYGIGYSPLDQLARVTYDAPDSDFTPANGKGFDTVADSWKLIGLNDGAGMFTAHGAASAEWTTAGGLVWVRANAGAVEDGQITIYNSSFADWEAGDLAWIEGGLTGALIEKAKVPQYPGVSTLVVLAGDIDSHKTGRAWRGGDRRIKVDGYDDLLVKDCLDAMAGSGMAQKHDIGPITVMAKLGSPYVLGRIGGERGDHVYVESDDYNGPAATIRVSQVHEVTDVSPGVVSIEVPA